MHRIVWSEHFIAQDIGEVIVFIARQAQVAAYPVPFLRQPAVSAVACS